MMSVRSLILLSKFSYSYSYSPGAPHVVDLGSETTDLSWRTVLGLRGPVELGDGRETTPRCAAAEASRLNGRHCAELRRVKKLSRRPVASRRRASPRRPSLRYRGTSPSKTAAGWPSSQPRYRRPSSAGQQVRSSPLYLRDWQSRDAKISRIRRWPL